MYLHLKQNHKIILFLRLKHRVKRSWQASIMNSFLNIKNVLFGEHGTGLVPTRGESADGA